MDQRYYLAALTQHPALGAGRLAQLAEHVKGDWERLWNENPADLKPQAQELLAQARKFTSPQALETTCKKHNIRVLIATDNDFPVLLREIPLPPLILFLKGNVELLSAENLVAIVGSRRMTSYGKLVIGQLIPEFVRAGCATVSGLALGVDAQVHRETLHAKGKTIAFLPCGITDVYPRQHAQLATEILVNGGALVSEFPLEAIALKQHFLIRNRLIAGIARATVVIEAAQHSGTQLTATAALQANREVFAVPGPITSTFSRGTNLLIRNGAHVLLEAQDVLEELGLVQEQKKNAAFVAEPEEKEILKAIKSEEPVERDELIHSLKRSATEINALLTILELKRAIISLPGNRVQRIVQIA